MRGNFEEDLVRYFNDELTWLRREGVAFAQKYPKIAARLELGPGECPDPHVERLIEAVAFLTARVRWRLDSDFPEIPQALLEVLYPNLVRPVPPATIARFAVGADNPPPPEGFTVAAGTPLDAASQSGPACRFRTSYPVTLWPVRVLDVSMKPAAAYDFLDLTRIAQVLSIRLTGVGGPLGGLTALDSLRFHIAGGDPLLVRGLYELINADVVDVVAVDDGGMAPAFLGPRALRPVGLDNTEALLPDPDTGHPGFRLIQEYFVFPEKFRFFDIAGLRRRPPADTVEILLCLDRARDESFQPDAENLLLGCTPALNLFPKSAEPVRLDHRRFEYPVTPDVRREAFTEIHSITRVSLSAKDDQPARALVPYFSFDHWRVEDHAVHWIARRRQTARPDLPGTEMVISFVDLDLQATRPPAETVYVRTLCTNRTLAEQIPAGALLMPEETIPAREILCLRRPTPTYYPELGGATLWRLVSQLSLNHLSLGDGQRCLDALREILHLYCPDNIPAARQQVAGLTGLHTQPAVRRLGRDAWRGFCQGTAITLEVDQRAFVGSSALMLGSVLARFLALYTTANSFVELSMTSKQREGLWKTWPPTAGGKVLI